MRLMKEEIRNEGSRGKLALQEDKQKIKPVEEFKLMRRPIAGYI